MDGWMDERAHVIWSLNSNTANIRLPDHPFIQNVVIFNHWSPERGEERVMSLSLDFKYRWPILGAWHVVHKMNDIHMANRRGTHYLPPIHEASQPIITHMCVCVFE